MRSLLAIGQSLCEPALFAHRTHQCDEFDHDESRCKAAQRLGAVEAAGDEQERQARQQAQQEADEILPSALGDGGQVFVISSGSHPASPCSALSGRARMPSTTDFGSSPLRRS